jgi:hypothetical protein
MKNKSVTAFLLVAVLSFTALGAASQARGDDTHPKLTSKQLRALIANAKTPEDHQKLATYYRDKAEQAKAEAAEHEKMLEAYYQNPLTHPSAKARQAPADHCRTLIRLFNGEQKEDLALADEHDQMAKAASQTQ